MVRRANRLTEQETVIDNGQQAWPKNLDPAARLGSAAFNLPLAIVQGAPPFDVRQVQAEQNRWRIIMETVTINPTQTASERIVSAVCVDVLDLGTIKTP